MGPADRGEKNLYVTLTRDLTFCKCRDENLVDVITADLARIMGVGRYR